MFKKHQHYLRAYRKIRTFGCTLNYQAAFSQDSQAIPRYITIELHCCRGQMTNLNGHPVAMIRPHLYLCGYNCVHVPGTVLPAPASCFAPTAMLPKAWIVSRAVEHIITNGMLSKLSRILLSIKFAGFL